MAVDENYLDNLLKNAGERNGSGAGDLPEPPLTAADRLRSMGIFGNSASRSIFSDAPISEPEPVIETIPESEPEAVPTPDLGPVVEVVPEPEPVVEAVPEPEPVVEAVPEPEPIVEPSP